MTNKFTVFLKMTTNIASKYEQIFFHIISCASIVNYKIYVCGICISHFSRKASECAILTVFNFKLDLNADYHLKY